MGPSVASSQAQPLRTTVAPDAGERAAHLVSRLPLADGLRVCLSLADTGSPSFEFAALRWHAGFCSRAFDITLREAEALLAALGGLSGVGRRAAAEELLGLSLRYHQDETVEVLYLWLRRPEALGL
jgi:hypothetical protein